MAKLWMQYFSQANSMRPWLRKVFGSEIPGILGFLNRIRLKSELLRLYSFKNNSLRIERKNSFLNVCAGVWDGQHPPTAQKFDFTGIEIAWVEEKSNRYPLYDIRKWPAWKDKHIGWLLECNTHAFCCRPRNFKILTKILKSISQGIGSKFWYLQNQLDDVI